MERVVAVIDGASFIGRSRHLVEVVPVVRGHREQRSDDEDDTVVPVILVKASTVSSTHFFSLGLYMPLFVRGFPCLTLPRLFSALQSWDCGFEFHLIFSLIFILLQWYMKVTKQTQTIDVSMTLRRSWLKSCCWSLPSRLFSLMNNTGTLTKTNELVFCFNQGKIKVNSNFLKKEEWVQMVVVKKSRSNKRSKIILLLVLKKRSKRSRSEINGMVEGEKEYSSRNCSRSSSTSKANGRKIVEV